MTMKKNRSKFFANNPSARIILITLVTMLIAIGGMLFLSINQSVLSEQYTVIVRNDVVNKESMSKISQELYRHQSLILQYMVNHNDSEKKDDIQIKAEKLQNSINQRLEEFGQSVSGTEYEPYYHSIYSDLNGYFTNISNVYFFIESDDIKTANYYMESSLSSYIDKVNDEISKFDSVMTDDMDFSENDMALHIDIAETSALVLILIVIMLSVATLYTNKRISDYIVNKDALTNADKYEKLQKDCIKFSDKHTLADYTGFFCNIKDFKFFNQRYGSKTGDAILKAYAASISGFLNKDERIARNGGDHFIILLKKGREEQFISFLSEMDITAEIEDESRNFTVNSRCGIYKICESDNPGDVFNACNMALTAARMETTSDFIWYENQMLDDIAKRREILELSKEAIKNHEFIVYYQPKVDMETSALCGCEALVRWLHEGNLISPGVFIPVLESEGKINELDFYVFEQVCSDISEWISKNIKPVRISSNFSKNHLLESDFAQKIIDIIRKNKINPEYIEIELTESSAYDDFDALSEFVKTMKANNIHTSMDDFGTGYSSLSLLKDLDVDVIKIDKSFIDDLDKGNKTHEKMVENVVHMIQDLNRDVICEGVETEKQAEFLKSIRCNVAQGYLYDKPLPHDDFEKRLISPVYSK